MENEHPESDDISSNSDRFSEKTGGLSQWLQNNARIIVSIAIVIAIAAGIYSYSNRSPAPISDTAETTQENTKLDEITQSDVTEDKAIPKDVSQEKKPLLNEFESQETETAFVETAARGEGTTHLARRALANYLEKNSDTALTLEHKIYIEDFLRKNVPAQRVRAGSSTEFGKDLIQSAIERSKNLNERQLNNLHKYVLRVPSLS